MLSGLPATWYLGGGWAVDAWLDRITRDHGDIDIVLFQEDQRAILEYLADWELIGHDPDDQDSVARWDGRTLRLPGAHVHARSSDGLNLDFLLNERAGDRWILRRDPPVSVDLGRAASRSASGLLTVVPEIVLFYKATDGDIRAHDTYDCDALLPRLDARGRRWLHEAIARVRGDHPWLSRIGSGSGTSGAAE